MAIDAIHSEHDDLSKDAEEDVVGKLGWRHVECRGREEEESVSAGVKRRRGGEMSGGSSRGQIRARIAIQARDHLVVASYAQNGETNRA